MDGHTLEEIREEQRGLIDQAEALAVESPAGTIAQMFDHVLAPSDR